MVSMIQKTMLENYLKTPKSQMTIKLLKVMIYFMTERKIIREELTT